MTDTVHYDGSGAHVSTYEIRGQCVIMLEAWCASLGVDDARAIAAALSEAADEVESGGLMKFQPAEDAGFGRLLDAAIVQARASLGLASEWER